MFPQTPDTATPCSHFLATCNHKGQALPPQHSRHRIEQKSAFHRSG
ncbi:unnamed protein product [Ectocarpus sp. CCAP 1310/34]|nr:unnamed protein product [Ectocarpus sp. CCAP 1310/34]